MAEWEPSHTSQFQTKEEDACESLMGDIGPTRLLKVKTFTFETSHVSNCAPFVFS